MTESTFKLRRVQGSPISGKVVIWSCFLGGSNPVDYLSGWIANYHSTINTDWKLQEWLCILFKNWTIFSTWKYDIYIWWTYLWIETVLAIVIFLGRKKKIKDSFLCWIFSFVFPYWMLLVFVSWIGLFNLVLVLVWVTWFLLFSQMIRVHHLMYYLLFSMVSQFSSLSSPRVLWYLFCLISSIKFWRQQHNHCKSTSRIWEG